MFRIVTYWVQTLKEGMKMDGSEDIKGAHGRYVRPEEFAQSPIPGDESDLRSALERANQMALEAEIAIAVKDKFLTSVNHEIRTPLNAIVGTTALLLDTDLDEEQRECVDILKTSANQLLYVVNDLLDFSKLRSGEVTLVDMDFDLRTMIVDVGEFHTTKARRRNLFFSYTVSADVPSLVQGDPGRLRQILTNLIDNSIRYTNKGGVKVSVELVRETREGVVVRFTVGDTGVGIPESKKNLVFRDFTQLDSAKTIQVGGMGLGLTIAKRLCEMMGGEIGFSSDEGRGSTFWFTAVLRKQVEIFAPRYRYDVDLRGEHVLVVDDSKAGRFVLTEHLRSWKCRYSEALDGESALQKLREASESNDPFSLAIIDREMPGMNGETLGAMIKNDPVLRGVKLVLMTIVGNRGDAVRVEGMGFSAYLTKPITHDELCECLKFVLSGKPGGAEFRGRSIITRHTIVEERKRRIRILIADDNVTTQKMTGRALMNMGYLADVVSNGAEALKALAVTPYDLVLMDIDMPVMSGFEAVAQIRDVKSGVFNHKVPIIAVTALTEEVDLEKCRAFGIDDYLPKPFTPKELASYVGKHISGPASRTTDPSLFV